VSRRRLLHLVTAVALVLTVLAPGPSPAQAKDSDDGLSLVAPTLAAMLPGQTGWISAIWTANIDVCAVQMTVTGHGVTISYPTNTATHTSLYVNSALAKNNLDYAAFKVAVDPGTTADVSLTVTASYRALPPQVINKNDDLATTRFTCSGEANQVTATATLPVSPATGAAVIQKTTAASVSASRPSWINLTFRGTRPNLDNFRVVVRPPAGLTVTYPGDGTSAGLAGGSTLAVGEDDYAGVKLDASGLRPGTYAVPIGATYTGGTFTGTLSLTVT
jgi:hypothetical protein